MQPRSLDGGERGISELLQNHRILQLQKKRLMGKLFGDNWQTLWNAYQRSPNRNLTVAQMALRLKKKRLKVHANQPKQKLANNPNTLRM